MSARVQGFLADPACCAPALPAEGVAHRGSGAAAPFATYDQPEPVSQGATHVAKPKAKDGADKVGPDRTRACCTGVVRGASAVAQSFC